MSIEDQAKRFAEILLRRRQSNAEQPMPGKWLKNAIGAGREDNLRVYLSKSVSVFSTPTLKRALLTVMGFDFKQPPSRPLSG